jgi:hypothetical protein
MLAPYWGNKRKGIHMSMDINWLAVVAAAVSAFVLGGLWYGPLFKNAWCRETGIDPNAAPGHPGRVFGSAFVLALVAAFAFAVLLGPDPSLPLGLHHGALVGGAFVATSFGINYAFAQRSLKLWLIDGGYHLLQFVLYGLILGLWH